MSLDSYFPQPSDPNDYDEDEFGDDDDEEEEDEEDFTEEEALSCIFCDMPLIGLKTICLIQRFTPVPNEHKVIMDMQYSCGNCKGHKEHEQKQQQIQKP